MAEQKRKQICTGLLAHVDAGKTTLSEAMLYLTGKIKKLGRVDNRDSFLDTYFLEKERGITIFSKQAFVSLEHTDLYLLDTPGHADFSAEAERTLQVMDYAVLVISGTDGVQAHTETLWKLLKQYELPCFVFSTKMDLENSSASEVLSGLKEHLSEACVVFSEENADRYEEIAMCSEEAMEQYLETGSVSEDCIRRLIRERSLFPVFFGSGLKTDGVEEFLSAFDRLTMEKHYREDFSAKVYKILRDPKGSRMTGLKITGGELKVRSEIRYKDAEGNEYSEKITQLRVYSGEKFETVDSAPAGSVCMALGLTATVPGMGLGRESDSEKPYLEPVMSYRVLLPDGEDPAAVLPKFMQLGEEDPQLHMVWNPRMREINVQLMGKVQTEVLKSIVKNRFDINIEFDSGHVMYRETIANKVEGVGHFEPLRHYAEVHLLLEPLAAGSGLIFSTTCSEDKLDRNWQRLILTHLMEKTHLGVLTGSPITDMKITLASGRAHLKHTEGGDFRQSTYRAVRQGLMQAHSILLEPYYAFTIETPPEQIGRVMTDVKMMGGEFGAPENAGAFTRLTGSAPVAQMNDYQAELLSFTRGRGRIFLDSGGYRPCRNTEAVVAEISYNALEDTENTADSVFCAHGAGFNVKWNEVPNYMHLESCLAPVKKEAAAEAAVRRHISIDDRELEAIMEREFGPIRRPTYSTATVNSAPVRKETLHVRKEHLIVDGYNVIFAWEDLKELAEDNLDLARTRLMDILSNYAGFTKTELVLVFDAYRTPDRVDSKSDYHNIHVVYTEKGETADAYIEKLADDIGRNYSVRVITGDNLIQLSALRSGVLRTSSREFKNDVDLILDRIEEILSRSNDGAHKTKLGELYGKH